MKKVKIKLTVIFDYELSDEFLDEDIQFHLEENHCAGNIIGFLNEQIESDDEKGICSICSKSEVEVINEEVHK